MAEPLGVVGSVISVVQLAQVVTIYLNGVKKAPQEKKDLLREILAVRNVLETFRDHAIVSETEVDDEWVDTLNVLHGTLVDFQNDLGRLKSKLESSGASIRFVKAKKIVELADRFAWPFQKADVLQHIQRFSRYEIILTLALENNAYSLLKSLRKNLDTLKTELKQDIANVKSEVSAVQSDTQKLVNAAAVQESRFRDAEFDKIIDWLSKINPWTQQADVRKRAFNGTGEWFLKDRIFQTWRNGVAWENSKLQTPTTPTKKLSKRLLWCPGIPGAGKSVMCSLIIDHLLGHYGDQDVAIAWMYCHYTQTASQSVENLMAAFLAQVITKNGSVSESVAESFKKHHKELRETIPQPEELQQLLAVELRRLSGGFIIIDALDESPTHQNRKQLISLLEGIEPPVQILVTSRPYPEIEETFRRALRLEVRATEQDIHLYLNGQIKTLQTLEAHLQAEEGLHDFLLTRITDSARGMFLMARLHLDAVSNLDTRRAVKQTLNNLPAEYKGIYDEAIIRIQNQSVAARKRAMQLLTWLAYAFGPLTISAIQHGMAVEEGDDKISADAIPNLDLILSWCAGLVTMDKESNLIRLVHYTTQEYLRTVRDKLLPSGHQHLATSCLTYLSFQCFSSQCCLQIHLHERMEQHGLFEYASQHWANHVLQGSDLEIAMQPKIVEFLKSKAVFSAEEMNLRKYRRGMNGRWASSMWGDPSRGWIRHDPPLHTACVLGLTETIRFFVENEEHDLESLNDFKQTPLLRAAEVGQASSVKTLLDLGANIHARTGAWRMTRPTALHIAANGYYIDVVKVLLDHGLDINITDLEHYSLYGLRALHIAAGVSTKLTKYLLERGADATLPLGGPPHLTERGPVTCLHMVSLFSMNQDATGRLERAEILIRSGHHINAQTGSGNTALHHALMMDEEMARLLLKLGADIHIMNKDGFTALSFACRLGKLSWLARDKEHLAALLKEMQNPGFLHKAIWTNDTELAIEALKKGDDPLKEDFTGNTALFYCVTSGNDELLRAILQTVNTNSLLEVLGGLLFDTALSQMAGFEDVIDGQSWPSAVKICRILLPYRRAFNNDMSFVSAIHPIGNYLKTYLINAVCLDRYSEVEFLLDCGSDMKAQDRFGETAAHYARDKLDVLKLLVERGTSLSIKNHSGQTLADIVEEGGNDATKSYMRSLNDPKNSFSRL